MASLLIRSLLLTIHRTVRRKQKTYMSSYHEHNRPAYAIEKKDVRELPRMNLCQDKDSDIKKGR